MTADAPILVAVNFSDHAAAALAFAAEQADKLALPLVVMHVVHDPGEAPGYYAVEGREQQLRRMEDVAAEMLESFLTDIRNEHPELIALHDAESMLVTGLPVSRILEISQDIHPYTVVMGSLGRTGLAHVLIGSKAEQVVRLCKVPVRIVKSGPE